MVPISQQHDTEVDVVVLVRRPVDDDATEDTLPVLNTVVAVVPGAAELGALECIRFARTRSDRTCQADG